jgi:hypothetical protein
MMLRGLDKKICFVETFSCPNLTVHGVISSYGLVYFLLDPESHIRHLLGAYLSKCKLVEDFQDCSAASCIHFICLYSETESQ